MDIIKRTEKLVSGLYLLTSFFDDKEPMKWNLRSLGGELLSGKDNIGVVLKIKSLLSVAKNSGLISDTNFEILHTEFSKLNPQSDLAALLKAPESEYQSKQDLSFAPEKSMEKPKEERLYISSSVSRMKSPSPTPSVIKDKKNERQNIIISLIKKRKEVQVGDVLPLIPGVSEKTIQRELLSMVGAKILRKIGEKRWSRYTLAE